MNLQILRNTLYCCDALDTASIDVSLEMCEDIDVVYEHISAIRRSLERALREAEQLKLMHRFIEARETADCRKAAQ